MALFFRNIRRIRHFPAIRSCAAFVLCGQFLIACDSATSPDPEDQDAEIVILSPDSGNSKVFLKVMRYGANRKNLIAVAKKPFSIVAP
ncbi:MAG TPA: hypothetical protein VJ385_00290 [Fibrobacteria bacterium]|nr:hypothetical protein [Fibrobacteria bacterium]